MFRTDYRGEALWKKFVDEYDPILEECMNNAPASLGVERIKEKLFMKTVDDDILADSGPAQVALAYRMFDNDEDEEDTHVEPGLQTKMCLMVDEECMTFVTERQPNTIPFVKAVDVTLGEDPDLGYPGIFKVAISSLITEFYPELATCEFASQLRSAVDDDIWQLSPDSRMRRNEWEAIEALFNSRSE